MNPLLELVSGISEVASLLRGRANPSRRPPIGRSTLVLLWISALLAVPAFWIVASASPELTVPLGVLWTIICFLALLLSGSWLEAVLYNRLRGRKRPRA